MVCELYLNENEKEETNLGPEEPGGLEIVWKRLGERDLRTSNKFSYIGCHGNQRSV